MERRSSTQDYWPVLTRTGYSRKLYGGHLTVPTLPAIDGYNGPDGYRKNTPELREKSSVFDYTGKVLYSRV